MLEGSAPTLALQEPDEPELAESIDVVANDAKGDAKFGRKVAGASNTAVQDVEDASSQRMSQCFR